MLRIVPAALRPVVDDTLNTAPPPGAFLAVTRTTVRLDNNSRNCESQAGAAVHPSSGYICTIKTVKDVLQVLWRKPPPIVANFQHRMTIIFADLNLHAARLPSHAGWHWW